MDNVRANEDWNVQLETSQDDPLLGESYVQFAFKGLQHQLSQGAGGWKLTEGRRTSYYKLIDSALPGTPVNAEHEKDFFDGIDTSLPALASRLGPDAAKVPWLRPQLEAIAKLVDEATAAVEKNPQSAGKPLLRGLAATREVIAKVEASDLSGWRKPICWSNSAPSSNSSSRLPTWRIRLDLGIGPGTPDGRPMAEEFETPNGKVLAAAITAGKNFLLLAKFHNGSTVSIDIKKFELDVPAGWHYELFMDKLPSRIPPGEGCALTFRVSPPANAQPTKAYFHRGDPETDALYTIDQPEYLTLPLPPPPVSARVVYAIEGQQGELSSVARTPMHGEHGDTWSMPLAVVPPFSVQTSPATQIIPAGANPSAELKVVVRGNSDHSAAVVRPKVPSGWKTEPKSASVEFARSGEQHLRVQGTARRREGGPLPGAGGRRFAGSRVQRRLQPGRPS